MSGARVKAAACALLALACGCAAAGPSAAPAPGPQPAPPAAGGAASLYDRPWVWSDERGVDVRLSRWRGTPVVVGFVYTSCTTTCPMTIEKLLRMDRELRRQRRPVEFVLVTLDPTTDTPEQLRRYKASRALPADWHLLRASDEQTQELADFLDVKIINDGSHVIHDSTIAVVDADGHLLGHAGG